MLSEFQKKMQETKDKAQEGLSEFQKKMRQKQEIEFASTKIKKSNGNRGRIRQNAFYIDLAADRPHIAYATQRIKVR